MGKLSEKCLDRFDGCVCELDKNHGGKHRERGCSWTNEGKQRIAAELAHDAVEKTVEDFGVVAWSIARFERERAERAAKRSAKAAAGA